MMVIPASSGNSRRQVQLIQDFGTTAMHITPSYALHLAQDVLNYGVADPRELGLKFAIMGAEPYSIGTTRKIEEAFGVKVFNCYGLSEMNGPAVAFECPERDGMHIWEDNYLVELLDPETLAPVPPGAKGELVLTTLNRTGMPILRYRTKDLTKIYAEPCSCGRTHRRIERILGRTDDMLIISGVNVFPSQIEHVLMELPEVGSTYQIVLTKEDHLDRMTIKVELRDATFAGGLADLHSLQKKIEHELKSALLVTAKVKLVEAGDIPPSQGKAVRVVDERGGN
jgi:phenylacetate-CoA ligase